MHLRFTTRGARSDLDAPVARCREALGEAVWGVDDDHLPEVALAALAQAGAATVASWEADTNGALLTALAGAEPSDGAAAYVGGTLDAGGVTSAPLADAVIQLSLLPEDGHGRSRVRVAVSGAVQLAQTELRIHGSGDQRLRRAAFAALDQVRRSLRDALAELSRSSRFPSWRWASPRGIGGCGRALLSAVEACG